MLLAQSGTSYSIGPNMDGFLKIESNGNKVSYWAGWHSKMVIMNHCGEIIDGFQITLPNFPNAIATNFIQLEDEGYIIPFNDHYHTTTGFESRLIIARISSTGIILWSKEYTKPSTVKGEYVVQDISTDLSGNILVVIHFRDSQLNELATGLLKIAVNDGHIIWYKELSIYGGYGAKIAQITNGDIVFKMHDKIVRVDSVCNPIWSKALSNFVINHSNHNIIAANQSLYLLASTNANQLQITKMDFQGNVTWQYEYLNAGSAINLWQKSNNNLLATTIISPTEFALLEIDTNGLIIQSRRINSPSHISSSGVLGNFDEPILPIWQANLNPTIMHLYNDLSYNCQKSDLTIVRNPFPYGYHDFSVSSSNKSCIAINVSMNSMQSSIERDYSCVRIPRAYQVDLGEDINVCSAQLPYLKNLAPDSNAFYLWSTGSNSDSILPAQSGTYWLNRIDECGNILATDTIEVSVYHVIEDGLEDFIEFCPEKSLVVGLNECLNCTYLWSTGATTPEIAIGQDGMYWVEVTNSQGCTETDSVQILPGNNCSLRFFMPNTFTPNNNGKNETIRPVISENVANYRFLIIGRTGLLFETKDIKTGWDGTFKGGACPIGVYHWQVEFTLVSNDEVVIRSGNLNLLR